MAAIAQNAVAYVDITPQLWTRPTHTPNDAAEAAVMRRICDTSATDPSQLLQVCAEGALELCHADTCGISLRERTDAGEEIFRWIALTGVLQQATATDYSAVNQPADDPDLLKGLAGSPYAIKDYFDVCPDYAKDPAKRLDEFKDLLKRVHQAGVAKAGLLLDLARPFDLEAASFCDFQH